MIINSYFLISRFREKYHSKENIEFLKQVFVRKSECLNEFEQDLLNGKWDSVNLNESSDENILNSDGQTNSYGIDLKSNATRKSNVLFITGVPLDIKRSDLLQVCHILSYSLNHSYVIKSLDSNIWN